MQKSGGTWEWAQPAWWHGAILAAALTACRPAPVEPDRARDDMGGGGGDPGSKDTAPWFVDVTGESGLDFHHDAGVGGEYRMYEHLGSGCAFLDYDSDGLMDLLLLQNAGPGSGKPHELWRQLEGGKWERVEQGAGLGVAGLGMGVAVGDVNNDGHVDVVLTEYGGVRLFLNQMPLNSLDEPVFGERTTEFGLANPNWATSASFLDYDRDGWLDLLVVNYIDYDPSHQCYDAAGRPDYCGPDGAPPTVTRLFRNVEGRRFADVTVESRLARAPGPGLGVICADFTGDAWVDIFLADDESPNRLMVNQGDGTFLDEAALRGVAYDALGQVAADMGVVWSDFNGDGWMDLFVTHLDEEFHNLWEQGPRGVFRDVTARAGLTRLAWRGTGFGAVAADFDLNGAVDLAWVNGRIKRGIDEAEADGAAQAVDPHWQPYAQRAQLLSNPGTGTFIDVSIENPAFCGTPMVGRGLAMADMDNDGDVDLLATGIGGPARLFRNEARRKGHWLRVRAVAPEWGGRDAYGAEIRLRVEGRLIAGLVQPGSSYLSSNDPRVHFGLGNRETFESIEVLWPDGLKETFAGGPADRAITLVKGAGRSAED